MSGLSGNASSGSASSASSKVAKCAAGHIIVTTVGSNSPPVASGCPYCASLLQTAAAVGRFLGGSLVSRYATPTVFYRCDVSGHEKFGIPFQLVSKVGHHVSVESLASSLRSHWCPLCKSESRYGKSESLFSKGESRSSSRASTPREYDPPHGHHPPRGYDSQVRHDPVVRHTPVGHNSSAFKQNSIGANIFRGSAGTREKEREKERRAAAEAHWASEQAKLLERARQDFIYSKTGHIQRGSSIQRGLGSTSSSTGPNNSYSGPISSEPINSSLQTCLAQGQRDSSKFSADPTACALVRYILQSKTTGDISLWTDLERLVGSAPVSREGAAYNSTVSQGAGHNSSTSLSDKRSISLSDKRSISLSEDNSSSDFLKLTYRSVARLIHPDKCPHPDANEAFQKLSSALRSIRSSAESSGARNSDGTRGSYSTRERYSTPRSPNRHPERSPHEPQSSARKRKAEL